MDISNLIKADEELNVIDAGAWVGDFEEAPNVKFLVRGMKSEQVQSILAAKQIAQRKKNRGKPLTDKQTERVMLEAIVEGALIDWSGLKDNGKDVPYSRELAEKWILSRSGEKLAEMVLDAALRLDASTSDYIGEVKKS